MKIAIVCSSAEPGRDGVGDYSVRLASSLIAGGHSVLVIAERDAVVAGPVPAVEVQSDVRVIRLPARAENDERGRWLAAALADFTPDWVLLQFVCWGFADRGVLAPPPTALISALSGRRVAVYCHELWLGMDRGASLRHRWWGWRQRNSILRFLALLRPAVVLASNPVYAAILQRFGWRAQIAPLVGNIPVHDGAAADLIQLLERHRGQATWSTRHDVYVLAIFGTVFPTWNPDTALRWFLAEAQRRGRRVLVVSIGRPSAAGEELLARLAQRGGSDLSFCLLGEASPRLVSGLLQEADVGLPSTDWMLLGKSGVAAAMLEHGLPMLVVRNSQTFRDLPAFDVSHPPSVFRFDAATPPDFDSLVSRRPPAPDMLPRITRELVTLLERAN